MLQAFLQNPGRVLTKAAVATVGFAVSYNQSVGLASLIEHGLGDGNRRNVNNDITQERFPLKGDGVRQINCSIEPYLDGETSEQAAVRLVAAGYTLGNTGDLAVFLRDHPKEVEKWALVLAISEDSRWAGPGGHVYVPYALVVGTYRYFNLHGFRYQLGSDDGVLVIRESRI
jgi:hypothetical protein